MDTMVTDLTTTGVPSAWATMINNPIAAGSGYRLAPYHARIPALQDLGSPAAPEVETLLGAAEWDILIVDQGGYEARHSELRPGGEDLTLPGPRAEVEQWVRDIASQNACGGASDQVPALQTLTDECTAAGIAVRTVVVNPWSDACLLRGLRATGLSFAMLQDTATGLGATLGARRGELMLIDAEGRVQRRALTGEGEGRDLDLRQSAARAQVIEWLQGIPRDVP